MHGHLGNCSVRSPRRIAPSQSAPAPMHSMLCAGAPGTEQVLLSVVEAMTGEQVTNVASQRAKALQPNFATRNPGMLGTNVLHDIDTATQVRGNAALR